MYYVGPNLKFVYNFRHVNCNIFEGTSIYMYVNPLVFCGPFTYT